MIVIYYDNFFPTYYLKSLYTLTKSSIFSLICHVLSLVNAGFRSYQICRSQGPAEHIPAAMSSVRSTLTADIFYHSQQRLKKISQEAVRSCDWCYFSIGMKTWGRNDHSCRRKQEVGCRVIFHSELPNCFGCFHQ